MTRIEELIRARVSEIERNDQPLAEELQQVRAAGRALEEARGATATAMLTPDEPGLEALMAEGPRAAVALESMVLETIVLRTGRPVLAIQKGRAKLKFTDRDSQVWKKRLTDARAALDVAIPAVGRVELARNPSFEWVGTGWLVDEDIVVTNRHVAREFARRRGAGFDFLPGIGGEMEASLDFLEEVDRAESLAVEVAKVMHIEGDDGPDIAFLRLKNVRGKRLPPIELASARPARGTRVAVIGYPARDSRIPEPQLMDRIFGNIFDKKRLAPGEITGGESDRVLHDCSTLGGNSGSAVIDLATGRAVGLHFAGRFLEANFAVAADVVADRLRAVTGQTVARRVMPRNGTSSRREGSAGSSLTLTTYPTMTPTDAAGEGERRPSVTVTVPVRVTVELGPVQGADAGRNGGARPDGDTPGSGIVVGGDAEEEDEAFDIEAPRDPASYDDRDGYATDFLATDGDIPIPEPNATRRRDVLTFERDGNAEHVLAYRHFSVVMSRSRRLCLFSAVNIDGGQSRKKKRTGWRFDPRIPQDLQILKECYGNAPKFSRGHMTRREDPVWGSDTVAGQGNDDSMHATNVVPQMQPFNAGIWLQLEDYALEHAREDDMKISVFTGPFLQRSDPVRFGVKIPVSFWKVIAFVHDETQRLSATGYTMSQIRFLAEDEFVFGRHETAQVPIATIERRAGLSFGPLSGRDPLRDAEEALVRPLTDLAQIRFV